MNADSRKLGKGTKRAKPLKKRRVVATSANSVQKRPTPSDPLLSAAYEADAPKLTREHLRALALDELVAGAVDAAKLIRHGSKGRGKRQRGEGQREASAKWLLDRVFELISDTERPADDKPATSTPAEVTNLAEAREALQAKLRIMRNSRP